MLIDPLVADRGGAVFQQPAADLIGAPLLLRQFFLDQFYEIWLHLAWRMRCCFSSLRRLLLRLFEAIAPRAGVAIQLALDRRAINAKLARYCGLREATLQEGANLATFFIGQMVIAFGHMSSVRCGVPHEDSLHLAARDPVCTTWKSVAEEKDGPKGARYARIAAGDLRPCPRPFCPAPMLRHVVYASLLHFGVETAIENLAHFVLIWYMRRSFGGTPSCIRVCMDDPCH